MKRLQSLASHNAQKSALHACLNSSEPCPNGIACPKCGAELLDSDPVATLTSIPPKKNVNCPECDYRGYRVA